MARVTRTGTAVVVHLPDGPKLVETDDTIDVPATVASQLAAQSGWKKAAAKKTAAKKKTTTDRED